MTVAIGRVLGTTRHRLCQWHICKKAPSKVPTFNNDRSVRNCFYHCMSKCDSEEEFNRYWHEMITKGGLHNNRWLGDLYNIRRRWSTAFNKDVLDLGILSTQRSESANNCLHGCSKTTSSLVECFLGMEKLVALWRRNERDEDFRCSNSAVSLRYKMSVLLKHISKQYTKKMYATFEKTFMEALLGVNVVDENRYDDRNILYITTQNDSVDAGKRWYVNYNSATSIAQCSCCGFETKGILCQHILRIYNLRNARQIPNLYVLKRFTLNARKGIYLPDTPSLTDHESNLIFRNHLMRFSYDLARQVENSKIAKEHVVSAMNALAVKVGNLVVNGDHCVEGYVRECKKTNVDVDDPPTKRPKGAPSARMKDHWERANRKQKPRNLFNLYLVTYALLLLLQIEVLILVLIIFRL
ncbi:Protein FAR1-RELATED SEQUENCE 7 [Platanthera zijinensis]|uniref:Protein FAR1-RELATED SEQUENCE n=1 Tax=Platanthera zijinensis TaxID=2320716 RepID=A0AAP0ASK0_9ASPA